MDGGLITSPLPKILSHWSIERITALSRVQWCHLTLSVIILANVDHVNLKSDSIVHFYTHSCPKQRQHKLQHTLLLLTVLAAVCFCMQLKADAPCFNRKWKLDTFCISTPWGALLAWLHKNLLETLLFFDGCSRLAKDRAELGNADFLSLKDLQAAGQPRILASQLMSSEIPWSGIKSVHLIELLNLVVTVWALEGDINRAMDVAAGHLLVLHGLCLCFISSVSQVLLKVVKKIIKIIPLRDW